MKKNLMIALITLCAVVTAACSNKPADDSADNTAAPITESTNKAPTTQAAPSDDTQSSSGTATGNTDNTQASPSPDVSVQSTPAPKNTADNTESEKNTSDNTSSDTAASRNTSAKTAASPQSRKTNKLLIGKKKAKAIALKDAGLKKKKVHFTEVKLDYDDGRNVYDIEFYSRKKEYDYEIDAMTGKILSRDWDRKDNKVPPANNTGNGSTDSGTSNNKISMKEAKNIALKTIGLTEKDGRWTKAKLDKDNGRFLYELEFVSHNTEHEFEIDANSGEVLEYDKEPIR